MRIAFPIVGTHLILPLGQFAVGMSPSRVSSDTFGFADPSDRRFRDLTDVPPAPHLWANVESDHQEPTLAWPAVARSLHRFGGISPPEHAHMDAGFLIRVARKLEEKGLRAAAGRVVRRAHELSLTLEPIHAVNRFLEIASFRTASGDRLGARAAMTEVERQIEGVYYPQQPYFLGLLWKAQRKAGDHPAAERTLQSLVARLAKLLPMDPERSPSYGRLAQEFVAMGRIDEARTILAEKIAPGYRIRALADLAKRLAEEGEGRRSEVRELVDASYADFLSAVRLRQQSLAVGDIIHLARQLLAVGPAYRPEAIEVCERLHHFLKRDYDAKDRLSGSSRSIFLEDAVALFAKAQCFDRAYDIVRQELRHVEGRSSALSTLVKELAQAGRFAEARDLLDRERLQVECRVRALMGLAEGLGKAGPLAAAEARGALEEAAEIIRRFELPRTFPGRSRLLADLGAQFAGTGDLLEAQRLFAEARDSAETEVRTLSLPAFFHWEKQTDIAMAELSALVLPRLRNDFTAIVSGLRDSRARPHPNEWLALATASGFRDDPLDEVLGSASGLPAELRRLVETAYYEGASFLPRDAASKAKIVEALAQAIESSYTSDDPHAERIHRIAARTLERLDPERLIQILADAARERLGIQRLSPPEIKEAAAAASLGFDASDRLLYQGLFWIARRGGDRERSLVEQLLWAPNLPMPWRRAFEKVLRRRGRGLVILSR